MKTTLYLLKCALCDAVDFGVSVKDEKACNCGHVMKFAKTITRNCNNHDDNNQSSPMIILDKGFDDPYNKNIRLNSKAEVKAYEKSSGKVLLSEKEAEQELKHYEKQREKATKEKYRRDSIALTQMIFRDRPIDFGVFQR